MTEEKREDLRKFVMEQQGETVAPSEEEALAEMVERAVNALVSISVTLEEIMKTQKGASKNFIGIG